MALWRYKAIPSSNPNAGAHNGEMAGESAHEVRSALRAAGQQVLSIRQVRSHSERKGSAWVRMGLDRHMRSRRSPVKAELFDSLATLLDAGVPMLDAIEAVSKGDAGAKKRARMLRLVHDQLRSGQSLSAALAQHTSWFDSVEVAVVEAGQHSGNLSSVLSDLAASHERSAETTHRLVAVLAYPVLVLLAAFVVVVVLSNSTLPRLTSVLVDNGKDVPWLTSWIMTVGQTLRTHWLLAVALLGACLVAAVWAGAALERRRSVLPTWVQRRLPLVLRQIAIARFSRNMETLMRSGVAAVDSLRITASTLHSILLSGLRESLHATAKRVERGEGLAQSLDDDVWFSPEFRRLVQVGETSGELGEILERLGRRNERQAARAIERFAAIIEPAMILLTAAIVGVVVLAVILPFIKMRELI